MGCSNSLSVNIKSPQFSPNQTRNPQFLISEMKCPLKYQVYQLCISKRCGSNRIVCKNSKNCVICYQNHFKINKCKFIVIREFCQIQTSLQSSNNVNFQDSIGFKTKDQLIKKLEDFIDSAHMKQQAEQSLIEEETKKLQKTIIPTAKQVEEKRFIQKERGENSYNFKQTVDHQGNKSYSLYETYHKAGFKIKQISYFKQYACIFFHNVKKIYLQNNLIENIEDLLVLKELQLLNVDNNRIRHILINVPLNDPLMIELSLQKSNVKFKKSTLSNSNMLAFQNLKDLSCDNQFPESYQFPENASLSTLCLYNLPILSTLSAKENIGMRHFRLRNTCKMKHLLLSQFIFVGEGSLIIQCPILQESLSKQVTTSPQNPKETRSGISLDRIYLAETNWSKAHYQTVFSSICFSKTYLIDLSQNTMNKNISTERILSQYHSSFANVQTLRLSQNNILQLPIVIFPCLKNLDMDHNPFKSYASVKNLRAPNLKTLSLPELTKDNSRFDLVDDENLFENLQELFVGGKYLAILKWIPEIFVQKRLSHPQLFKQLKLLVLKQQNDRLRKNAITTMEKMVTSTYPKSHDSTLILRVEFYYLTWE